MDKKRLQKNIFKTQFESDLSEEKKQFSDRDAKTREATSREIFDWISKNGTTAYIYDGSYSYNTKYDNQLFIDLGDWGTFKSRFIKEG